MGENRNSYSKTDHDANFHENERWSYENGQLKAGYNMQIAIANEYVML